ncbi:MAG: hypothetical protein ACRDSH_09395, partial [Pseudonocardiaceae bacterium]
MPGVGRIVECGSRLRGQVVLQAGQEVFGDAGVVLGDSDGLRRRDRAAVTGRPADPPPAEWPTNLGQ